MSRTYRNKHNKPSWANNYFVTWYPWESKRWQNAMFHKDGTDWFMSTPMWWHKEFHTVPRRAKTRMGIQKVYKLIDYEDDVEFPLDKKPHIYYW